MSLVWEQVKTEISQQIKRAQFETWVKPTEAYNFDGQTLHVTAINAYACEWLTRNIKTSAQQIIGVYVNFTVPELEDA